MYSTDPDKPPKRPVTLSLSAALAEVDRWARENLFDTLVDGDGLSWRLTMSSEERPARQEPRTLEVEVRFLLRAEAEAETFVATGTLDRQADARLIGLLEDVTVPLAMKPIVRTASGYEAARRLVRDELPRLKSRIAGSSLHEVKRALIGRFVDERCLFGATGENL